MSKHRHESVSFELATAARGSQRPHVVMIDGRSGSGKTTLARAVAHQLGSRAQVLPVEHLYPGWDGLEEGANAVAYTMSTGTYRAYDWHAQAFTSERHLDPARPLVIEGCGALSRANLAAAERWGRVWCVWVECPEDVRKRRALTRDGDVFRPYWDMWARQESARMRAEQPIALAHQIVHTGQSIATPARG